MSGYYSIGNTNGHGQVVGTTGLPNAERAFVYTPGSGLATIGPLPGDYTSRAYGINELGQVLASSDGSGKRRFFIYTPGTETSILAMTGLYVEMRDINDAGQIAGRDGSNHGMIYTPGASTTDLGNGATGYAISDSGWAAAGWHSIYVPGTGVVDLGFNLNGYYVPTGINDLGQIVFVDGRQSFIYDWHSGVLNPLDAPGYTYATAYNIDNAGNVTGLARDAGGTIHVVAWTPVPEPSSALAFLAGLGGIAASRLRRRRRARRG